MTPDEVVTGKGGRRGGSGGGKGSQGIQGTNDDHQQVKLKEKTGLDTATPHSSFFSFFFARNLSFYPPLEESVCRRGVLKAAPVKAAIIITLRG